MFPLLLIVLASPRALALDTEPNDSCASPELLAGLLTVGDGTLSSGSDVDAFRVNGVPPGVLNVVLMNRSNPSGDFELQLYNGGGARCLQMTRCQTAWPPFTTRYPQRPPIASA